MAKTIGSFDLASLKNLRDDVTQYFWFESNSSSAWGSGAHVTLYPESQFTNPNHANYLKGQNIIMNTDGFSIRNGSLTMMVLDNDSLDFNAVDTSLGTYTTMATFGLTGATIGRSGAAHSVIDANGQRFYASDGTTQLANIGYGLGTDSGGGTSNAPYYTLGERLANSTVGNFSVAFGLDADANGYCSYAEGMRNTSNGEVCHAEGWYNTANGFASHVEGQENTADNGSHAEGYHGSATGVYSHTQNLRTVAGYNYQTAIGKYNDNQSDNAFEIGNGTADNARSNALTVDWSGNVNIPSGASYNINDENAVKVYLTPKTTTVNGSTGTLYLHRTGNVVQMSSNGAFRSSASSIANGATLSQTIPSGYRPINRVYCSAQNMTSTNTRLEFATDGSIRYYGNNAWTFNMYIYAVWVTGDDMPA